MIDIHLKHKGEATILVTKVDNPSRFGIVVHDPKTKLVSAFIEKPKEYVGNFINAGMYIFDKCILNKIQLKKVSLEREIFPKLAKDQLMYVKRHDGFWKDIGLPSDFLNATKLILDHLKNEKVENFEDFKIIINQKNIYGINMIHKSVKLNPDSLIGPFCVIHKDVSIGKGVRLKNSVIMDNCQLDDYSQIQSSILMDNVKVGKWSLILEQSIISNDVTVDQNLVILNKKINPNVQITENNINYCEEVNKQY